jgi:hypothetical protein
MPHPLEIGLYSIVSNRESTYRTGRAGDLGAGIAQKLFLQKPSVQYRKLFQESRNLNLRPNRLQGPQFMPPPSPNPEHADMEEWIQELNNGPSPIPTPQRTIAASGALNLPSKTASAGKAAPPP